MLFTEHSTSKLKDSIKRHEGCRLKPYRDTVGKLTIGYGRNLDDNGITMSEAEMMLEWDISVVKAELTKAKPELMHSDALSDERKDVLYEMAFNMGVPKLLTFHKTWAALDAHNYGEAAAQMLDSTWAQQVGIRAQELAKVMKDGR